MYAWRCVVQLSDEQLSQLLAHCLRTMAIHSAVFSVALEGMGVLTALLNCSDRVPSLIAAQPELVPVLTVATQNFAASDGSGPFVLQMLSLTRDIVSGNGELKQQLVEHVFPHVYAVVAGVHKTNAVLCVRFVENVGRMSSEEDTLPHLLAGNAGAFIAGIIDLLISEPSPVEARVKMCLEVCMTGGVDGCDKHVCAHTHARIHTRRAIWKPHCFTRALSACAHSPFALPLTHSRTSRSLPAARWAPIVTRCRLR
jgi:hypothetical protein